MKTLRLIVIGLIVALGCARADAQSSVPIANGVAVAPTLAGQNSFKIVVNQNITSFSFSGVPQFAMLASVIFNQNGTGGYTVTGFASNITSTCTITTTANASTVCLYQYDPSSNSWFSAGSGSVGGSCTASGSAGVVQASNGSSGCQTTAITDNGSTVNLTEPLSVAASDGNATYVSVLGNTGVPTVPLNSFAWIAPPSASFTSYACQLPVTPPSNATPLLSCGTPSSGIATGTWVAGAGASPVLVPTTSAANTIAPTTASVDALTLVASTGGGGNALTIKNSSGVPTANFDANGNFNMPNFTTLTNGGAFQGFNSNFVTWIANTIPTIAGSGCGGSGATISSPLGTSFTFDITVGTAPTSGGCTVTMPSAKTRWNCAVDDYTTISSSVFVQKQTASTASSVTFQNYNTSGAATAPSASDIYHVVCGGL